MEVYHMGKRNENIEIGKIYIIENDVNDKVYIGQTSDTIEGRFRPHIYEAIRWDRKRAKFQDALREIGAEHFRIRELERCSIDELNEREIYYIKKYDSYNNGYNSTEGGDGIRPYIADADIQEFVKELTCGQYSALDLAQKYRCTPKTINSIARSLGVTAVFKDNTYDLMTPVVMYDLYFNMLNMFDTLYDAHEWVEQTLDKHVSIYNMVAATKTCGVYYGYRWQIAKDLVGKNGKMYVTTIDKMVHERNPSMKLETVGKAYKIEGIDYTKYVGESARQLCPTCGNRLNKNNICDKCRINNAKQSKQSNDTIKIARISELLDEGKNLTHIGNEFGVSANAIKTYCERHGIDYKRVVKRNPEIVYAINTKNGSDAVMSREELYNLLVQAGICKSDKYGFYGAVKADCINSGKTLYGYQIQYTDRTDFHISDGFLDDPRTKSEIIRYYPDMGGCIDFNTWGQVGEYLRSMNITNAEDKIITNGIKQSIKIRNGRRFKGTWQLI